MKYLKDNTICWIVLKISFTECIWSRINKRYKKKKKTCNALDMYNHSSSFSGQVQDLGKLGPDIIKYQIHIASACPWVLLSMMRGCSSKGRLVLTLPIPPSFRS